MAARCETVLNTTMAEIDTYHTQKNEDFKSLTTDILDDEIALYEQVSVPDLYMLMHYWRTYAHLLQVLAKLKNARRTFDDPQYNQLASTSRQPSMYERELEHPRLDPAPVSQPCPHVFDSAPMRPVSVAIQEGVGMLLGSPTRQSVFGKFW